MKVDDLLKKMTPDNIEEMKKEIASINPVKSKEQCMDLLDHSLTKYTDLLNEMKTKATEELDVLSLVNFLPNFMATLTAFTIVKLIDTCDMTQPIMDSEVDLLQEMMGEINGKLQAQGHTVSLLNLGA